MIKLLPGRGRPCEYSKRKHGYDIIKNSQVPGFVRDNCFYMKTPVKVFAPYLTEQEVVFRTGDNFGVLRRTSYTVLSVKTIVNSPPGFPNHKFACGLAQVDIDIDTSLVSQFPLDATPVKMRSTLDRVRPFAVHTDLCFEIMAGDRDTHGKIKFPGYSASSEIKRDGSQMFPPNVSYFTTNVVFDWCFECKELMDHLQLDKDAISQFIVIVPEEMMVSVQDLLALSQSNWQARVLSNMQVGEGGAAGGDSLEAGGDSSAGGAAGGDSSAG
jgi:hypothetical protein